MNHAIEIFADANRCGYRARREQRAQFATPDCKPRASRFASVTCLASRVRWPRLAKAFGLGRFTNASLTQLHLFEGCAASNHLKNRETGHQGRHYKIFCGARVAD